MQYLKFWLKVISFLVLWGILLPRLVHAQPGTPDPTFGGGDGFSTTSFLTAGHAYPSATTVQPNGRILVAGGTWLPDGTSNEYIALARFMPNGMPDITFGGGAGKVTTTPVNLYSYLADIVVLPDGKILGVGGAWNYDDTEEYFLLARFNADGTPDNSFDGDGFVTTKVGISNEYATAMALQPDGKVVVVGSANKTGYSELAVLRYKSNGTLDNTFGGGDGIMTTPVGESYSGFKATKIQSDGKIVAAGYAVANGFEDFVVVRDKSDGTLDPAFGGGDGIAMASFSAKDDNAYAMALQTDGKIVLGGFATSGPNNDSEIALARFNANGVLDNTFSDDGLATAHLSNYGEDARAIVIQPDGKILLGGNQGAAPSERKDFALVRFTPNGLPDNSFDSDGIATLAVSPDGSNIEAMTLQPDGKVVAVGAAWASQTQRNSFAVARFITGVTVDTNTPDVFTGKITLYPNPVHEQATLEYELQTTQKITVNLYDVQGRFIQNLLPATPKTAGKHTENLVFDQSWPSGSYLLVLESESGVVAIEAIF